MLRRGKRRGRRSSGGEVASLSDESAILWDVQRAAFREQLVCSAGEKCGLKTLILVIKPGRGRQQSPGARLPPRFLTTGTHAGDARSEVGWSGGVAANSVSRWSAPVPKAEIWVSSGSVTLRVRIPSFIFIFTT